jgi:hypothetical protein
MFLQIFQNSLTKNMYYLFMFFGVFFVVLRLLYNMSLTPDQTWTLNHCEIKLFYMLQLFSFSQRGIEHVCDCH